MPKENKRRGKREEKRRNRDEDIQEHGDDAKRQRTWQEGDIENTLGPTRYLQEYPDDINAGPGQVFFYGLLDEEEQSYFRRADTVLELNRFADPDERALFIANVYREVIGKELKIASSQSCSRFLERLICMSTTSQLKCLFQSFNGQYAFDSCRPYSFSDASQFLEPYPAPFCVTLLRDIVPPICSRGYSGDGFSAGGESQGQGR